MKEEERRTNVLFTHDDGVEVGYIIEFYSVRFEVHFDKISFFYLQYQLFMMNVYIITSPFIFSDFYLRKKFFFSFLFSSILTDEGSYNQSQFLCI